LPKESSSETRTAYPPAITAILEPPRTPEIGPGRPNEAAHAALAALAPESLVEGRPVDRQMALAAIAGLWLYHDYLGESHTISQGIDTPTGSYWHAIMHLREGDFGNSKYWFRRVGQHPVFDDLPGAALAAAKESPPDAAGQYLLEQNRWDPFRFVDLCEEAREGRSNNSTLCREILLREWQLLFDFCYRQAVGA